jgi:Ca-activated chloride channel family protein
MLRDTLHARWLLLPASCLTLGLHSIAEARRLDQVVVVGRVSSAGQPLRGVIVSMAGRGERGSSGEGGRYTITLARAREAERATLLVRHQGYEPWQRSVVLEGDTVRVDIALTGRPVRQDALELSSVVVGPAASTRTKGTAADAVGRESRANAQVGISGSVAAAPVHQRVMGDPRRPSYRRAPADSGNTEAYDHIDENPFRSARVAPLSTFAVDVDRASYSNVRRFLTRGALPPRDAVRIEELVNYFPYADPAPSAGEVPLRITTEVAPAPWNERHDLVRIALRARDIDMRRAPANNLVFLVDVSGSMQGPTRLPLVKQSLALLVNELREEDRVSIVVYAGSAGLVLPSTPGSEKQRILAALDGLEAGGSTAGGAGIRLAYDVAKQHFIRRGNNRVVLCTDGDFNVGQSSDGALVRLIEERRREGTFLTILGYGMGNYKDAKMEKLADAGNGNYGYIDDLLEARKMLVHEMGGTLVTVAKDVKLQVEFNPARVAAYRLLGYENRLLRDEDFANDAKDAGEVGAGHTVTALYEIVRTGVPLDVSLPETGALRYQRPTVSATPSGELLHVAMRYKSPDGDRSMLVTHPVGARGAPPSESMRFASAVAGFGMLLRGSPHAGSLAWPQVIALARGAVGADRDGYRADFIRLAELSRELTQGLAAALARRRD